MAQQRKTRDQQREEAREAARLAREGRAKRQARNKILIRVGATVGALALIGAIAGGVWLANRPAGPGPLNMASDGIVLTGSNGEISAVKTEGVPGDGTPTPTDPDDFDAPAHIVTYIDFACPHCNTFETANGALLEELVSTGAATLEVHPISIMQTPFSAFGANAAACVAAEEPDSFLDALQTIFSVANGSSQDKSAIRGALNDAGLLTDGIASCINGGQYEDWVKQATARAVADPSLRDSAGGFGTPRILVNGTIYQNAIDNPAVFAAFVAEQSNGGAAPEPTPAP